MKIKWKNKLVCLDLDGTLCDKTFPKEEPQPIIRAVNLAKHIHLKGGHIIIWTARQEKYYPETKAWLVKNKIPFVAIAMRHKPQADYYIDDKAINIKVLTN